MASSSGGRPTNSPFTSMIRNRRTERTVAVQQNPLQLRGLAQQPLGLPPPASLTILESG